MCIFVAFGRTSSASEYSAYRDQNLHKQKDPSLVDGWIPERPPKNPLLRVPSPDLPPAPIPVSQTIENGIIQTSKCH